MVSQAISRARFRSALRLPRLSFKLSASEIVQSPIFAFECGMREAEILISASHNVPFPGRASMIVGGRFQNFRHVWSLLAPALSCPIVVHVCAVNSLPPPRRRISGSRRMRVSLPSISVQIDYLDACEVRPERAPFVLPTTDALLSSDSSSSTPIRLSCCRFWSRRKPRAHWNNLVHV